MGLTFQMVGTGNAFAKKFYNNNALLTTKNCTIMIDFGITAPAALYKMNIPYNQIQGILITHIHADHVGGLEEYAFQMKYIYRQRPKLYISELLAQELWNHCLRGGLENVHSGETTLESYFDVILLKEGVQYSIDSDLTVELIRTEHVAGKLSYSVFINDSIFYSADMKFDRSLLEQIDQERQCDIIFHDCQFSEPGVVHATLNELLSLPDTLQQKIYLMHYDDNMELYAGRTGKMRFILQQEIYTLN